VSCSVCPQSVSNTHITVCWFCVTVSTAVFYSPSTVSQYLTQYSTFVLCHYANCRLLQSVQYLSVLHTVRMLVLRHYVHYRILQSVPCLSVLHNVLTVSSLPLSPLVFFSVCPLYLSTSHCTVCQYPVTLSTGVLFSPSNVSQYLAQYCLSVPCHFLHWCLVQYVHCISVLTMYCLSVPCPSLHCHLGQSVHCLLVSHTVLSSGSLTFPPQLSSSVCPLSLRNSHCTVCQFPVPLSTGVLFSLSNLSQYLTLYCLSVPCPSLHWCLVQSVQCLSVPPTVLFVSSGSLSPLVSCSVCPLSVDNSHCIICQFPVPFSICVLFSLSTDSQYLTMYCLSDACHSHHWCLVQSVQCLLVPHTVPTVSSVSLSPLVAFSVCPR